MNTKKSCHSCGACSSCDRCDHCGKCRNCGKEVTASFYNPYLYPYWTIPQYPYGITFGTSTTGPFNGMDLPEIQTSGFLTTT